MTTILDQITSGARLIATPPTTIGGRWTYKLNNKPTLLTAGQFMAVQRSTLVSVERLAGNRLLYRKMTQEERKAIRAQWREWKRKVGKK